MEVIRDMVFMRNIHLGVIREIMFMRNAHLGLIREVMFLRYYVHPLGELKRYDVFEKI